MLFRIWLSFKDRAVLGLLGCISLEFTTVFLSQSYLSSTTFTIIYLTTCIFPLTNVFMSFSFSKIDRVCNKFCSSHSQCSVISFLEQPAYIKNNLKKFNHKITNIYVLLIARGSNKTFH